MIQIEEIIKRIRYVPEVGDYVYVYPQTSKEKIEYGRIIDVKKELVLSYIVNVEVDNSCFLTEISIYNVDEDEDEIRYITDEGDLKEAKLKFIK